MTEQGHRFLFGEIFYKKVKKLLNSVLSYP